MADQPNRSRWKRRALIAWVVLPAAWVFIGGAYGRATGSGDFAGLVELEWMVIGALIGAVSAAAFSAVAWVAK